MTHDNPKEVDVNALPVHLLVKSQKEAKKVKINAENFIDKPSTFRKSKRFAA